MKEMAVEVNVQKPAKVGIYSGYNGGKSTQLADYTAEFTELGMTMTAVIYARLSRDKDTGEESITIEASLPKGCKFEDEADGNEFKSIVLASAQVWFGYLAAEQKAYDRLTGKVQAASSPVRLVLSAQDLANRQNKVAAQVIPYSEQLANQQAEFFHADTTVAE